MITFRKDSTNFLQALIKDNAGAMVNDATVTATIRETYGGAIVTNAAMQVVAGQTDYNYQLEVAKETIAPYPNGIRYEAEVTAVRSNKTRSKTEVLEFAD